MLAAGSSIRFKNIGLDKPKGLLNFKWKGLEGAMLEHSGQLLSRPFPNVRIAVHSKDLEQFGDWVSNDQYRMRYGFYYTVATNGQADTAQQAVEAIEGPIVVVNCDNGFNNSLEAFASACSDNAVACGVLVFESDQETRYGYVDAAPWFTYGTEKTPVSKWALAGAFYFSSRHVLREAYAATPFVPGQECYLSQLFAAIKGLKLAFRMPRTDLHEWGTPSNVVSDKTITISDVDWDNMGQSRG